LVSGRKAISTALLIRGYEHFKQSNSRLKLYTLT